MSLEGILAHCVERWREAGIALLPPDDASSIERVYASLGAQASRDVLCLYSTVGGFEDYQCDEDLWSLWSLVRLQEDNAEFPRQGIAFCDWSIRACTWELRYEDQNRSSVWLVEASLRIAPDLETFFQRYLDDFRNVLWNDSP